MSAPSPTKAPWLKEPKFVYELMHNGWSKGVENMRNRFYCQLQFDRTVTPEEQEAYTNLIYAAPELLEALKEAEAALNFCIKAQIGTANDRSKSTPRLALKIAINAIYKAEGVEP